MVTEQIKTSAIKAGRWMRPRVVLFIIGVALASFVMFVGLVSTPFFGGGLHVWGNVLFGGLVVMVPGLFLGERLARISRPGQYLDLLVCLSGGLILGVTYAGTDVHRLILGQASLGDYDALTGIVSLLVIAGLPVAMSVPIAIHACALPGAPPKPDDDKEKDEAKEANAKKAKELAKRDSKSGPIVGTISSKVRPSLVMFPLGGALLGAFVASNVLFVALELPIWVLGAAAGGLLCLTALTGAATMARVLAILLLAAFAGGSAFAPREIMREEFQEAVQTASSEHLAAYYELTRDSQELRPGELQQRIAELRGLVQRSSGDGAVIERVIGLIRNLGKASLTGDGLREIFRSTIEDESMRTRLLPVADKIQAIRSDGKGRIHFSVTNPELGEDVVRVVVAGDGGDPDQEFVVKSDFYVDLALDEEARTTTISIGPLVITRAGFFESNDSYETPLVAVNAVGPFDAHLIAVIIEETDDEIVIKAQGQGVSLGPLTTSVLTRVAR